MKEIFLCLAVVLSMTSAAWADQPSIEKQRQLRNGNRKIWIGIGMIVGGAIIAPLTAATTGVGGKDESMTAGVGVMIAGSGIVWWGARQRRRAVDPQIAVGVSVGRRNGLFVRRTW